MNEKAALVGEGDRSLFERTLDTIERVREHGSAPGVIFLALCGTIIVLSQAHGCFNISATY